MEVFTYYGVGIKVFAIERKPDGRVEFTLWATGFFVPLWPLSSWSAIYAGPVRPDGIKEDGYRFYDEVPIQREVVSHAQTYSAAIVVLAAAIAPIAYFIVRTTGRAATTLEMVLVLAACVWPIVVINLVERYRRKQLTGAYG